MLSFPQGSKGFPGLGGNNGAQGARGGPGPRGAQGDRGAIGSEVKPMVRLCTDTPLIQTWVKRFFVFFF